VRHGRQNQVNVTVNEFADSIRSGARNKLGRYSQHFRNVSGKFDFKPVPALNSLNTKTFIIDANAYSQASRAKYLL
jgi:hypothetical protein